MKLYPAPNHDFVSNLHGSYYPRNETLGEVCDITIRIYEVVT